MVPLRSATTLLGRPALISDCAPMMLRVRPAQLTTTVVAGNREVARPQHKLGARHVDASRDRHTRVFVERTAVEHHDVRAPGDKTRQLVGRNAGRCALVLDELAERLAW